MPTEATFLILSILLYMVMILVQAALANFIYSPKELLGARDGLNNDSKALLRARRANANMVESLLVFVPLVLLALILEKTNATTELGATLFFAGRVVFAPLYWFKVPYLRTLAWLIAFVGAIMILTQVWPF